ncbi:MAG TPA: PaaI family thioesterase [Kofleriaceae bacterium]|nr:PaaI family thioesterase [Kofleriaceae bacterium]
MASRMVASVPAELPTVEAVNAFFAREFPAAHAGGHRCVEIGPGFALARWPYDATQLRPGSLISGPTQFALADLAFWFLSFTVVGLAPMAVTSELYISFLRPAAGGDLLARAELLRAGKNKISGSVRVWVDGAPDRPVSHVVGSYVHLR